MPKSRPKPRSSFKAGRARGAYDKRADAADSKTLVDTIRTTNIADKIFALETLAIAGDSSGDYVKTTGVDGKVTLVFDKENFARQRLRIKARKMILARMAPRKYRNP